MRGFPKSLKTKFDYMYITKNFDKTLWLPYFKRLKENPQEMEKLGFTASEVNKIIQGHI